MSEAINGIISAAPVLGPVGVAVSMLIVWLFSEKKKAKAAPDPVDSLGPIVESAVDKLGMKYIRAKLDADKAKETERIDDHSDAIKTLRDKTGAAIKEIDERVRKTENDISGIKADMKNLTSSVGEIKQDVKDGNKEVMDFISKHYRG